MQPRLSTLMMLLSLILASCAGRNGQGSSNEINPATQTVASQLDQSVPSTREPGCTVVGGQPAPGTVEQDIIPTPGASDWSKGPDDAYVTLIEYSDFQ